MPRALLAIADFGAGIASCSLRRITPTLRSLPGRRRGTYKHSPQSPGTRGAGGRFFFKPVPQLKERLP